MYLRLLRRNRDFRLLYADTLISLGGDWFLTVALLDLVLSLTGSATLASLMLLCQSLPIFIVTPLAGHVVDREDFEADQKNDYAYSFLTYDRVGAATHPIAEEG